MAEPTAISCFQNCSEHTLLERLLQELPSLEITVAIIHEFRNSKAKSKETISCDSCIKKNECKKPCDAIEAQLAKPNSGKNSRERNISIDLDDFDAVDNEDSGIASKARTSQFSEIKNTARSTFTDIFAQYEQCFDIFTKKQREVLKHYYRDGKTITEISQDLKKAPSTVSELLKRANEEKEKHDAKLRKEKFRLIKNMETM